MKYKLTFLLLCFSAFCLHAEVNAGKAETQLRVYGAYGYNYAWGHYGNLDLAVRSRINPNFELDAAAEASIANVYTLSFNARPVFPVPVGELYLDTRLLYKAVVRDRMHDAAASFGLGYRMDYVDLQIGMYSRLMADFNRDWHSEEELLVEPLGIIYSIEVFVRPQSSRWNLSFRFTDFDEYQIERLWQPLFMIGASFNPTERLSILAQAQCKPTGMFHLNASFYGAIGRVGIAYKF